MSPSVFGVSGSKSDRRACSKTTSEARSAEEAEEAAELERDSTGQLRNKSRGERNALPMSRPKGQ